MPSAPAKFLIIYAFRSIFAFFAVILSVPDKIKCAHKSQQQRTVYTAMTIGTVVLYLVQQGATGHVSTHDNGPVPCHTIRNTTIHRFTHYLPTVHSTVPKCEAINGSVRLWNTDMRRTASLLVDRPDLLCAAESTIRSLVIVVVRRDCWEARRRCCADAAGSSFPFPAPDHCPRSCCRSETTYLTRSQSATRHSVCPRRPTQSPRLSRWRSAAFCALQGRYRHLQLMTATNHTHTQPI